MKDEDLWNLIELARRDNAAYLRALEQMSNEELLDYYWEYEEIKRMLMTSDFIPFLEEPVTENAWEEVADWTVGQGLDYFEEVLFEPEKILPNLPKGTYAPHYNEHAALLYEKRTGRSLPFRNSPEE